MLPKQAKELIKYYVSMKRKGYWDLTEYELKHLIAVIIRNLPDYVKAGVISDSDYTAVLPDLIANYIENKSIDQLVDGINNVFVYGLPNRQPAFYNDIEELFNDEWSEQFPAKNNEHFENDAMNRAYEAQWGQSL